MNSSLYFLTFLAEGAPCLMCFDGDPDTPQWAMFEPVLGTWSPTPPPNRSTILFELTRTSPRQVDGGRA